MKPTVTLKRVINDGDTAVVDVEDIRGEVHTFNVTYTGWVNHRSGKGYIQDNFPELTPAERELFLSGIPADMWDEIFINDDE